MPPRCLTDKKMGSYNRVCKVPTAMGEGCWKPEVEIVGEKSGQASEGCKTSRSQLGHQGRAV